MSEFLKKAKDAAANVGDKAADTAKNAAGKFDNVDDKAADMGNKVADILADKAGDVMNAAEKLKEKAKNIL